MSYEKIMDEYIISHGDAWREKFEHARLYNYLPPFCDEEEFLRMAIHHTQERGYKPGYAAVLYKEMFKKWPDGYGSLEPLEPSSDFLDWLDAKAERMRISRRKKRKPKKSS